MAQGLKDADSVHTDQPNTNVGNTNTENIAGIADHYLD